MTAFKAVLFAVVLLALTQQALSTACSTDTDCGTGQFCCAPGDAGCDHGTCTKTAALGQSCVRDGNCDSVACSNDAQCVSSMKLQGSLAGWAIAVIVVALFIFAVLVVLGCLKKCWRAI